MPFELVIMLVILQVRGARINNSQRLAFVLVSSLGRRGRGERAACRQIGSEANRI